MLTIRRHQSAMFTQLAVERFVGEMVVHLREHLPAFATLGDEGGRQAVRYGIGRARSYRIESEAGVRVFIQMMAMFGPGFDSDAKLPWAARWLRSEGDEAARIRGLLAAATDHLQAASGPGARS